MNKQKLLEKRYIVRLLALILEGEGKSNKEIAEQLKISASSIHKQLAYLERQDIIFKERDKNSNYNRKVYIVGGNKLTELFLKYITEEKGIKDIIKFKNNIWINGTLCIFIFSTLNQKNNQNITLKNIFDFAFNSFLSFGKSLAKGSEDFLKRYKANKNIEEKTKKEFKSFILTLKKNFKKPKFIS